MRDIEMPTEHRYETNCCGTETIYTDDPLRAGDDARVWCDECNWTTTEECVESVVVDKWGHVL